MANPALVLLRLPVQIEGANRAELRDSGPEDEEVNVVPEIDPDEDEEAKVGANNGGVKIVECFGRLRAWG